MAETAAITYKYRAYPDEAQREILDFHFAAVRWFWNRCVESVRNSDREFSRLSAEGVSRKDMPPSAKLRKEFDADVTALRAEEALFPYRGSDRLVKEAGSVFLRGACGSKGQLKAAIAGVFEKRKKSQGADMPGFRSYRDRQSLRWQVQEGAGKKPSPACVTVTGPRRAVVQVPRTGKVVISYHRPLPEDGRTGFAQVVREVTGKYYVLLTVDTAQRRQPAAQSGSAVGIDRGITVNLAVSDGRRFDTPGLTARQQWRLRHLQRGLARKRLANPCGQKPCGHEAGECWKRSARYRREQRACQLLLEKQGFRVRDGLNKAVRVLADSAETVYLEELSGLKKSGTAKGTPEAPGRNVKAKAGLNREQRAANWGRFEEFLKDRASRVVAVPAAYTSQECPACGVVDKKNRRSQAVFKCIACGFSANADLAAAQNILRRGMAGAAQSPEGQEICDRRKPVPSAADQGGQPVNACISENVTEGAGEVTCEHRGSVSNTGSCSQDGQDIKLNSVFEKNLIPGHWGVPGARGRLRNRRSRAPKKRSPSQHSLRRTGGATYPTPLTATCLPSRSTL